MLRREFLKSEKGQSLVEFALILPILIFLLLAIMEGGRIFASYVELQNAARAGTRYASIQVKEKTAPAAIKTYIENRLTMLEPSKLSFDIKRPSWTGSEYSSEKVVEIELNYPLEIITPIISNITGNPFNLKVTMSMSRE